MELEIQDEFGNLSAYSLAESGIYRLGKSHSCEIVVVNRHVSRLHARITVADGCAQIEDMRSTNGVWHEGRRLDAKTVMRPNACFQIGSVTLTLRKASAPPIDMGPEENASRKADEELNFKQELHARLLEYLDRYKRGMLHQMSSEEIRLEAETAVRTVLRETDLQFPSGTDPAKMTAEVVAEAVGLGAIEPFMQDETVTEVMVNGPTQIYLERSGRIEPTAVRFSSNAALMSCIERIVTPIGRRVDEGSPMVDARLPDGSRVNVVIPPLSLSGPVVTIRKFSKRRFTLTELVRIGTLSEDLARFLEVCVKCKKNIVVSGGTGSGKTTLLNALSDFIPAHERIVTIEDAAELQLNQRHVVSLEARPPNIEGRGAVSIRDLVRNTLRMRPDRIVVGECRGAEALDMLQAMNTGHEGSLTTGHANSPRDFLSRLEVMISMAGLELPLRAIREQAASAIDIIVQQARLADGTRKVTGVVEVDGMEGDTILLQQIFEFEQQGREADGRIVGEITGRGYAPTFYDDLKRAGMDLDRSIFGRPGNLPDAPTPDWDRAND